MFVRPLIPSVLAVVSVTVAVPSPSAFAQNAVFGSEITVTATGTEEETDEVPLPITVIDDEELEDAQTESVTDVLRRVPGLTVVQSAGPGSATSIFTRGTESDHTLVMIDGVRLNSPFFGGFDLSQLTTAGVAQIEVVRGPYSALWGADAIGGAINLIPSRGLNGFTGSLFAEGGEGSWQRLQADASFAAGSYDLYASGLSRSGEGDLDNSDFDTRQGLINAGLTWGRGSRLSFLLVANEGDLGIPFSQPGTPTPLRRQKTDQRTVAVPLTWAVSDHWTLEATVSEVDRSLDFSDPEDPWGLTWSRTETASTQVRMASHHEYGRNTLSWGSEWRRERVTDASSYGSNLDDDTQDVFSVFAQDVWRFNHSLTAVFGARWDDTDTWGSEFSPRLDLGWRVADRLELRAGYGEAYRQPSVGELYYPLSGNPDLEPETSRSVELGLAWSSGRTSGPRLELSVFSTDVDHLILFDYVDYRLVNVGRASIDGIEGAVSLHRGDRLQSHVQLTWLDTADDLGNELLRRPTWSGSLTVSDTLSPRFTVRANAIWVGRRPDVDPLTFATTDNPGFVTADLALAARIVDGVEVTARATNLLDRPYQEVLGYSAPGRRVIAGLRIAFENVTNR